MQDPNSVDIVPGCLVQQSDVCHPQDGALRVNASAVGAVLRVGRTRAVVDFGRTKAGDFGPERLFDRVSPRWLHVLAAGPGPEFFVRNDMQFRDARRGDLLFGKELPGKESQVLAVVVRTDEAVRDEVREVKVTFLRLDGEEVEVTGKPTVHLNLFRPVEAEGGTAR